MFWVIIAFPLLLMDDTQRPMKKLLSYSSSTRGKILDACVWEPLRPVGAVAWRPRTEWSPCDALVFSRTLKYSWGLRHLGAAIMPVFFYRTIAVLLAAFELIEIPLAGAVTTPCQWEGVNKSRQTLQHSTFFSYTKPQQKETWRLTKGLTKWFFWKDIHSSPNCRTRCWEPLSELLFNFTEAFYF